MLTPNQFRQLVKNMRAAQNHFFQYRTQPALIDAKSLEADVDKDLKEWDESNVIHNVTKNLNLFPEDKGY